MKKVLLFVLVLAALAATVWFVRAEIRTATPAPAASPGAAQAAVPSAARKPPLAADYPILYAAAEDRLRVKVDNMMLAAVLAEIMRQSSLEIRIDPLVDRPVSIAFEDLPIEQGVDRLTAGLNVIKEFRKTPAGANLLVALTVLPAGKQDASAAVRAVDLDTEMGYQAGRVARAGNPKIVNRSLERWQARLDRLPPEVRKRYDELLAREQKRLAERAERHQAFEARQEKLREKLRADAERIRKQSPRPPMDPEQLERLREQLAVPEMPESIPPKP